MPQFTYELELPPGINSDDTTFAAKGRWADGSNVRFVGGKPQAIGGYGAFGFLLTGICRGTLLYNGPADAIKAVYGTDSKLYYGTPAAAAADITPASGWPSTGKHISLAAWGTTLLAAPCGKTLFEYSGTGVATEVAEAPDEITRMLVSAERRQVIAFGCNEEVSGDFNGRCIRWCDFEDYTNWTGSPTNNAGENILSDAGVIVGAEQVGSYLAVWTETSLLMGQFVGDPLQTWRFDLVASGCGLIATGAVAVLGMTAYWMGRDGQFYTWTPGGLPDPIPCPISRDFIENFTSENRQFTHAGTVAQFEEVWFFYLDDRGVANGKTEGATHYLALNTKDGTWFRGEMDISATLDIQGMYITNQAGGVIRVNWVSGGTCTPQRHEILPQSSISRSWHPWHLQSADQYLDSGRRRVMIQRFVPDFEEQRSPINLTIFVRSRPRDDVTVKGPYVTATNDTKKDLRASGTLFSVKFSASGYGNEEGNLWRCGKPTFDCVTLGER